MRCGRLLEREREREREMAKFVEKWKIEEI